MLKIKILILHLKAKLIFKMQKNYVSDGTKKIEYKKITQKCVSLYQNKSIDKLQLWKEKKYPETIISKYEEHIFDIIDKNQISAIICPIYNETIAYISYIIALNYKDKIRVVLEDDKRIKEIYRFQKSHSDIDVGFLSLEDDIHSEDDKVVYYYLNKLIINGDILVIVGINFLNPYFILYLSLIKNKTFKKIIFIDDVFDDNLYQYYPNIGILNLNNTNTENIFIKDVEGPLNLNHNLYIKNIIETEYNNWNHKDKKICIVYRPTKYNIRETAIEIKKLNLTVEILTSLNIKEEKFNIIITDKLLNIDSDFVIDDMLILNKEADNLGIYINKVKIITKTISMKRKINTNKYYAIISKNRYEMLDYNIDINKLNLDKVILTILSLNLQPRDIINISIARYDQILRKLYKLNMVTTSEDNYVLTECGLFVLSLPVDIYNGYIIYKSFNDFINSFKSSYDTIFKSLILSSSIALACLLEKYNQDYFIYPIADEEELKYHERKYFYKYYGNNDIKTLLSLFWDLMLFVFKRGRIEKASSTQSGDLVIQWITTNSLNQEKLKEFYDLFKYTEAVVESMTNINLSLNMYLPNGFPDMREQNSESIGNLLCTYLQESYYDYIMYKTYHSNFSYSFIDSNEIFDVSNITSLLDFEKNAPKTIFSLYPIKMMNGNMVSLIMDDMSFLNVQ